MPSRGEVDLDHGLEILKGLLLDGLRVGHAGVVDEDIERAQRTFDLGDEAFTLVCIGKIRGEGPDRRMFSGQRSEPIGSTCGNCHGGTRMGQHQCHPPAQTRRCPGDQRGASGEIEHTRRGSRRKVGGIRSHGSGGDVALGSTQRPSGFGDAGSVESKLGEDGRRLAVGDVLGGHTERAYPRGCASDGEFGK